jgi:hypothetical protein
MRNLAFAAAGLAILGFAAPTISAASAETVIIKRHYDNGWHRGWRGDMGSRRVIVERHDRAFIAASIVTEERTTPTRCLIPGFDGAPLSPDSKDALWDRFFTAAPQRQRRSVERYSIVKRA